MIEEPSSLIPSWLWTQQQKANGGAKKTRNLLDDQLFPLLNERGRLHQVALIECYEDLRFVLLCQCDSSVNHLATEIGERNGSINKLNGKVRKAQKRWGKDPFWIECSLQFLWVPFLLCCFHYELRDSNIQHRNLFCKIPGVSWKISCVSPIVFTPKISSRVVFTLWLTAETFFPINEFMSVLFPELGAPHNPTSRIFVLFHL